MAWMFEWKKDMVRFMKDASEQGTYYQRIVSHILLDVKETDRVCDCGCGLGNLSLFLSPYVKEIDAVDCCEEALSVLNEKISEQKITNIHPLCARMEDLPSEKSYDVMIFHFFGDSEDIMNACRRHLKGKMILLKKANRTHGFSDNGPVSRNAYEEMLETMEKEKLQYETEVFSLDFSQPFHSFADAKLFFQIYHNQKEEIDDQYVSDRIIRTDNEEFPYQMPYRREVGRIVAAYPQKRKLYLDYAATAPLKSEVREAMIRQMDLFANPSSLYSEGLMARKTVDEAREKIAALIHAQPREICFTSGGSEADNWVLSRIVQNHPHPHIITTEIEHHAVLETAKYLEKNGIEVTYIRPDCLGRIHPEDIKNSIRENTVLISVMTANNEIGTIQPIAEIGAIAAEHRIPFHTDAVQAYGHMEIDVNAMQIDYLSASAHKIGGPKGIGFLYMRKGKSLTPLIFGGSQENGRRAGTENTVGIAGFARAAECAMASFEKENEIMIPVRDLLIRRMTEEVEGCSLNGDPVNRLANNAHFCIEGTEGEALIRALDRYGIMASSGAACSAGSSQPSHVLKAIGRTHVQAYSGLRFSIGPDITVQDVDYILESVKTVLKTIR